MTSYLNIGAETRVNSFTASGQLLSKIATLLDGTYVVTWESLDQIIGGSFDIYSQHYDAAGHKIGTETQVNITTDAAQRLPSIAALDDGGYVIVWQSIVTGQGQEIMSRTYNAQGLSTSSEVNVNITHPYDQINPTVTGLVGGGYIVTWEYPFNNTADHDVWARTFGPNGTSGEFVIASTTTPETDPIITALSDGGFSAVYEVGGVAYYRTYNEIGDTKFDGHTDAGIAVGGGAAPDVTALSDGGFVITWVDIDGSGAEIFAVTIDGNGNAADPVMVNTTTVGVQSDPAVTALDGGGYVVIWTSGNAGATDADIYGQVMDSDGNRIGAEFQVNSAAYASHLQGEPDVSALAGGGFVVTWDSATQDGDGSGVYQRVYSAAGSLSGSQVVYGTSDADILDGGSGADTMYGGLGDDTYIVNSTGDIISEENGGGVDTLQSYISFVLTVLNPDVENLTLMGGGAINGTGTSGNNILIGNANANNLSGLSGNDTINGGAGDDFISGGGDDDVMNGGDGNDTLYGSVGNDVAAGDSGIDTYEANSNNGAAVINLATGKSLQAGFVTYLESIENMRGTSNADILTGNAGDNAIDGGSGADNMAGGLGDDSYTVDDAGDVITESSNGTLGGTDLVVSYIDYTLANYVEDLYLVFSATTGNGNSRDNVITGNDNANLLDGKGGADTVTGGTGDDTYWVDIAGDVVIEKVAEGMDTVRAGLTYSLGANIENLVLTGTGNFAGTGNAAVNSLTGNAGNNILDGHGGADTMIGGKGDDTYIVDDTGDNVVEANGEGTDTINASVTYTLSGRFVETLALTGSANINATGNSQANTLVSNAGNNSLTGSGGADVYKFLVGSKADTVTDFNSSQGDSIDASAYHAVSHTVTLSGTSVIIDFGGGNTVTVLHATVADVSAHTIF